MKKSFFKTVGIVMLCILAVRWSNVEHFNNLAENEDKRSVDVLLYIGISEGNTVADLGAGGGYYSFRLARAVGSTGKVYAVDVDPESIAYIKKQAVQKDVRNVEVVPASYENSNLKPRSIDILFVRNAYHDIQNRVAYFSRIKSVLKPNAKVVIIDYDPDKQGWVRKLFGHALNQKVIIYEMAQSGYSLQKSISVLQEQSFNIFTVSSK